MKIILTGGGSGGHFYPIIAIVQAMRDVVKENKLIEPKLFFLAPEPYNKGELFNNGITFKKVIAGKLRVDKGSGAMNFIDMIRTFFGIIGALWTVFWIYPDVVFSKGGYGAFPVVFAARILRIPVIIHESDSAPGRVNAWTGKFAKKIAVSYSDASKYFDKERVAWTGNPVRKEIVMKAKEGGHEFLNLDEGIKTILVLGGSQGAQKINEAILDILPHLLEKYQVVHQTGAQNYKEAVSTADFSITDERLRARYRPFPYLNNIAMRTSAGVADLVITRAGSTLFEVANWQIPAIVIPITNSNGDHQRKNAFAYARSGAGIVIEENNLKPTVLKQEIERILETEELQLDMMQGAANFAKPDAAKVLANAIIGAILKHEK